MIGIGNRRCSVCCSTFYTASDKVEKCGKCDKPLRWVVVDKNRFYRIKHLVLMHRFDTEGGHCESRIKEFAAKA